jgi:hypothetical protein
MTMRDFTDAERFAMAIGCPVHGPKAMDHEDGEVFCTICPDTRPVLHGYDEHGAHSYADTMAGCGDEATS